MMTGHNPAIGPWHLVTKAAEELLEEVEQATIFQVFECDHCGALQQNAEPDTFVEVGTCECGKKTDLTEHGCGFVAILGDKNKVIDKWFEAQCGGKPHGLPS